MGRVENHKRDSSYCSIQAWTKRCHASKVQGSRKHCNAYSPARILTTEGPIPTLYVCSFPEAAQTMRMHMRRFTRLTNGFSKKLENHMHAISLHFMYYNFCKIHKTLRVTPAMEAKVDDHVWTMEEVVMMTDTNN